MKLLKQPDARFGVTQHASLRKLAEERRFARAAFEQSVLDALARSESDVRSVCEALRLAPRPNHKRVLLVLQRLEASGLVECRVVETDRKRNVYRAIRAEAAE